MINFAAENLNFKSVANITRGYAKDAIERIKTLQASIDQDKYKLAWELYSSLWLDKLYRVISNGHCHPKYLFSFCEKNFDLDKSTVSRYLNIVAEFGNGAQGLAPEWKDYKWHILVELLPLSEDERRAVKPDWTRQMVREYKKDLEKLWQEKQQEDCCACATNETEDKYTRFDGWKKAQFCDRIIELEEKVYMLEHQIQELELAGELVDLSVG